MGLKDTAKEVAGQLGMTEPKPRPGESEEDFKRRQDEENNVAASTTGGVVGGSS